MKDKLFVNGVIFDMDGVIFDSERIYIECCMEVAAKYGMTNVEEVSHRCIGTTSVETRRILIEAYGEDFPLDQYWKESTEIFWQVYKKEGHLPVKEGVRELLADISSKKIPIAIGSSTRTDTVRLQLKDAGLLDYFTRIIGGDLVERSKPAPDVFLKAAEALGAEPGQCLVIEDSYNGIRAARAAGIYSVMVPDLLAPNAEMEEKAGEILPSLKDLVGRIFPKES